MRAEKTFPRDEVSRRGDSARNSPPRPSPYPLTSSCRRYHTCRAPNHGPLQVSLVLFTVSHFLAPNVGAASSLMDRPLPPNQHTTARPDQLRHGQAASSIREIPTAAAYYPDIRQMEAAGGWQQHQVDGQQLGWEQQADGRSQLRRTDYNSSSSIPVAGGCELQQDALLPWLENAAQGGQRQRVLAPNSSAAASASNPFLHVCSRESNLVRISPYRLAIVGGPCLMFQCMQSQ